MAKVTDPERLKRTTQLIEWTFQLIRSNPSLIGMEGRRGKISDTTLCREFGPKVGTVLQSVHRWLRGQNSPDDGNITAICEFLGLPGGTIHRFLDGEIDLNGVKLIYTRTKLNPTKPAHSNNGNGGMQQSSQARTAVTEAPSVVTSIATLATMAVETHASDREVLQAISNLLNSYLSFPEENESGVLLQKNQMQILLDLIEATYTRHNRNPDPKVARWTPDMLSAITEISWGKLVRPEDGNIYPTTFTEQELDRLAPFLFKLKSHPDGTCSLSNEKYPSGAGAELLADLSTCLQVI